MVRMKLQSGSKCLCDLLVPCKYLNKGFNGKFPGKFPHREHDVISHIAHPTFVAYKSVHLVLFRVKWTRSSFGFEVPPGVQIGLQFMKSSMLSAFRLICLPKLRCCLLKVHWPFSPKGPFLSQ